MDEASKTPSCLAKGAIASGYRQTGTQTQAASAPDNLCCGGPNHRCACNGGTFKAQGSCTYRRQDNGLDGYGEARPDASRSAGTWNPRAGNHSRYSGGYGWPGRAAPAVAWYPGEREYRDFGTQQFRTPALRPG